MPKLNDLRSSRFLAKEDVEPPVLVTIKEFEKQDVSMENEPADLKWTVYFEEQEKPMTLNLTNGGIISDILGLEEGEDLDPKAIGLQIILYNDKTVMFGGKRTGGIRVRAPKQNPDEAQSAKTTEDDIPF